MRCRGVVASKLGGRTIGFPALLEFHRANPSVFFTSVAPSDLDFWFSKFTYAELSLRNHFWTSYNEFGSAGVERRGTE